MEVRLKTPWMVFGGGNVEEVVAYSAAHMQAKKEKRHKYDVINPGGGRGRHLGYSRARVWNGRKGANQAKMGLVKSYL